jgi:hypothetical protein
VTPAEFRRCAYLAFDTRNREGLEVAIRALTDPDYAGLTINRLMEHRSALATQLAACDEYVERHRRAARTALMLQEADVRMSRDRAWEGSLVRQYLAGVAKPTPAASIDPTGE